MEKYGFVYIWYDRARKMFYIGSHWGTEDDGYICSSNWMRHSYARRPQDFQKQDGRPNRRIISRIYTSRKDLLIEEQRWLEMIKDEELTSKNSTSQKRKNVRYYNVIKRADHLWHADTEKLLTVGEKISASKIGKSLGPCSPEKAQKISEIKKAKFAERGGMSEKHKQAIKDAKAGKNYSHTEKWKTEKSKDAKEFWDSLEGQALKEKRKREGRTEESKKKTSVTLKGRKPSENTIQASIKKCSKTYKVISPDGKEMTITNLKAFCRERGLTDINMVRKSGSKGWKAYPL